MPVESELMLFEDKTEEDEWRVEYYDDDGGCYVTIFAGPGAEQRARDYHAALKDGTLKPVTVGPPVN
jgi:hypothetical protein